MAEFDTKFRTIPKPTHPSGIMSKPTSLSWKLFGIWAWSPIVSFQVGLTAGYIALVYFGISGLIATPPAFDNTSPEGFAWVWAIGLILGAVFASIGSISRHHWFERLETAGASLLSLTIGSYALLVLWIAYGLGDSSRIAGGAGFAALAVPIIVRTMWLYSQLLRPVK